MSLNKRKIWCQFRALYLLHFHRYSFNVVPKRGHAGKVFSILRLLIPGSEHVDWAPWCRLQQPPKWAHLQWEEFVNGDNVPMGVVVYPGMGVVVVKRPDVDEWPVPVAHSV